MSTHYVLGTILGARDRAENRQTNTCPHKAYVCIFLNFI